MSDLQFLRTLAECSTDEAADLVESYDGYDMLDEDFDEYGDLTEAFFKKSDDKQKKKAETIGNKMVQYLNQGNQKKANKEAAKLTKILKLKPIKLPAPIMSALKKCTDSMNKASANINKTMDSVSKKMPKFGKKNESYAGLRSIAEGSTTWSDMHSQAQQFGTARPGAGFDDWEDDSCPYTGEPEEMDEFPRGGNFDEFEGLRISEAYDDTYDLFESIERDTYVIDESAEISAVDLEYFCEAYCDALTDEFQAILEDAVNVYDDEDVYDEFVDNLAECFDGLLIEAAYAVADPDDIDEAQVFAYDVYDTNGKRIASNATRAKLHNAADKFKTSAKATGAKAAKAAKYAGYKAKNAAKMAVNITKTGVRRSAAAASKAKDAVKATGNRAATAASRKLHHANMSAKMAYKNFKNRKGIRHDEWIGGAPNYRVKREGHFRTVKDRKTSKSDPYGKVGFGFDGAGPQKSEEPPKPPKYAPNRETRRANGERGMSNFGRKKRLHADAADEYDFEMVEECVTDPVAFSGFLSETFD